MGGGVPIESHDADKTWVGLKRDANTVLIDVRTISEWAGAGLPDLPSLNMRPVLVEWPAFPDDRLNAAFVDHMTEAPGSVDANKDSELLFICRSGSSSLKAAGARVAADLYRCWNVADGFEGPLDTGRHRGRLAGPKANEPPWAQR